MMNNSKILTVSYGTFSCTLEGFDDSFGTMKAIAEYFRDLASEDRYFGAEPPQPDAEMLAHIAQREVSRRVRAREQDGKIVLSAVEESQAAATTTQMPAPGPLVSTSFAPRRPNEISTYYDAYRMNALNAATSQPEEKQPRATQEKPPAEPKQPQHEAEQIETAPRAAPVQPQPAPEVANVAETPAADTAEDEIDIVPGQPDEDVEAFFAESTADAPVEDFVDETDTAKPLSTAKADSIAAKLQRIRAVVSRQESAAADPDYSEDEHAEDTVAQSDDAADAAPLEKDAVVTDAIHDIEDALDADDATVQTTPEEDADEDDDVSAFLSRLDADDAKEDAEAEAEHPVAPQEDTDANNIAAAAEDTVADDIATAAEQSGPPATDEAPAPRGRVIKVKRADLDRAIAKGDLEEYDNDDAEDTADAFAGDDEMRTEISAQEPQSTPAPETQEQPATEARSGSTLSAEEEAELARELAEVEAAIQGSDASAKEKSAQTARRVLPSLDAGQGSDINRLLAETDTQMDDPENTNRRDAITNLRAAVAAKKADVALGASERAEDDDAYRNDLAEAVKPRRPATGGARTERPGEGRPAPLKLVAEQRIDTVKSTEPVRPRRVVSIGSAETSAPAAGGFAEFASEMGAVKLPDLLEAAAAYMAFVEGLEQFSRPQLMNTVRQVDPDEFSREDGLRSFGQLLRTGKLHKLDGGRFRASEDIGFQPDARAVG